MGEEIIDIVQVSKSFGSNHVLQDINLKIYAGQSIAFIGHNGCGKSTLLRVISHLARIDKGQVVHHKKLKFSYIPEHFPQLNFTARQYIQNMGRMEGLSAKQAQEQGEKWFRTFFMESMAQTPLKYLSKGTLQKVGVIQALLSGADVLLMDEPLSGQDVESQNVFMEVVKELNNQGLTVIMSCHEKQLIERLAGDIYEISEGSLTKKLIDETFLQEYDRLLFEIRDTDFTVQIPEKVKEVAKMIEQSHYQIKMDVSKEKSNEVLLEMLNAGFSLREMRHVQE